MTVGNVYGGESAPKADAAAKTPEMFENHYVVGGKVQPNYRDRGPLYYAFGTDIKSLQDKYDEQKADGKKTDGSKEEGYTWSTPFTWSWGVVKHAFSYLGDMIKGMFFCFSYDKADAEAVEGEKKAETTVEEKKAK